MGEKNEVKKEGAEKKTDAGGKKDDGSSSVVLKIDLHCEGCAKKIKRSIHHFEGVECVKAECDNNKLIVTGKVDPARLKERLEYKTKMKVEILSPQPKKDAAAAGGGGNKKSDEKKPDQNKPAADDKKPKQVPQESTVAMKIRLHCDGCIHKIKKIIKKIDGVNKVTADLHKDLVTIVGTMNMKELIPSLKEKLKRNVEIIPPKKDDDKKGGGSSGSEKKKTDGSESKTTTSNGDVKAEAKKTEYYGGYNADTHVVPTYNHNYFNQDYGVSVTNYEYTNRDHVDRGYVNHGYMDHGYANHNYAMQYTQPSFTSHNYAMQYSQPSSTSHNYSMQYSQPSSTSHSYVMQYSQPSSMSMSDNYVMQYSQPSHMSHNYVTEYSQTPPVPQSGYFNAVPSHQIFSDENPVGCFVM